MSSKDISVRVNAIITLGFIGIKPEDTQEGIDALIRALSDPQGIVRYQAARTLSRLATEPHRIAETQKSVPALIRLLNDQYCWEIRAAAAESLGTVGWLPQSYDPGAQRAVLNAINDSCIEVRLQSLLSVIQFGRPAKPADLQSEQMMLKPLTAEGKNKRIAIWAHVALGRLENKEEPSSVHLLAIAKHFKDKDFEVRTNAMRAICYMRRGAFPIFDQVLPMLEDKDPVMVGWTCIALGEFGPKAAAAIPSLKKLATHTDEGVRKAAAEAIKKIDEEKVNAK